MSKIEILDDDKKILKNDITQEYFQKDPYMALRFAIALKEMKEYSQNYGYVLKDLEKTYSDLSKGKSKKLPVNYNDKIEKVREGIKLNQDFYNKVVSLYSPKFDYIKFSPEEHEKHIYFEEYLIRHLFMGYLMRDWTEKSKEERDNIYGFVLRKVNNFMR